MKYLVLIIFCAFLISCEYNEKSANDSNHGRATGVIEEGVVDLRQSLRTLSISGIEREIFSSGEKIRFSYNIYNNGDLYQDTLPSSKVVDIIVRNLSGDVIIPGSAHLTVITQFELPSYDNYERELIINNPGDDIILPPGMYTAETDSDLHLEKLVIHFTITNSV